MDNDLEPIRFLTLRETAKLLHLSTRTLLRMIKRRDVPAFRVGGQWRFRESELTKWLHGLNEL